MTLLERVYSKRREGGRDAGNDAGRGRDGKIKKDMIEETAIRTRRGDREKENRSKLCYSRVSGN